MIPQDFIDDLLSRTDIVELVRSRVDLKSAGREYKACCPCHNEKTPSFHVVPHKQFYHCFGCGAHGNALRFVMDHDRLEFRDAIEALANLAGVAVPDDGQASEAGVHQALLQVLDKAQQRFRAALTADSPAHQYLERRGVNAEMIQRYELGYAPPGWDFLTAKLTPLEAAIEAGLVASRDGKQYDRFRNRLIFPIRDSRGRIVAFGGRALDDDPAKYLNSPESPVFHKGRLAYGLYEARQHAAPLTRLIVVEGYMDVIALAQHGFGGSVATLGTATSAEHLKILTRQCRQIVFCFDGDAAGRRAADRALDVCLAALRDGLDIRFLFLPEGDDPDDLVRREGEAGFSSRLDAATPLSERLITRLSEGTDLQTAEGRAALVDRAKQALAKVDAPAFRAVILQRIEALSGLGSRSVSELLGPAPARPGVQRRGLRPPSRMTPVRRAVVLLLNYPVVAEHYQDVERLAAAGVPGCELLAELLDRVHQRPELHCAALIQGFAGRPEQQILERLALVDLEIDAAAATQEFASLCDTLVAKARTSELAELLAAARRGELDAAGRERLSQLNRGRVES